MVLEAGSLRAGCQHGLVLGELGCRLPMSCHVLSGVPLIRALIPLWGPHPRDLITPKALSLMPSHWGLEFQHGNFGGLHSVHKSLGT